MFYNINTGIISVTDLGSVREHNEDSCVTAKTSNSLFVLLVMKSADKGDRQDNSLI
jgi:hypothetical protein